LRDSSGFAIGGQPEPAAVGTGLKEILITVDSESVDSSNSRPGAGFFLGGTNGTKPGRNG
jgi:hypothetical protein